MRTTVAALFVVLVAIAVAGPSHYKLSRASVSGKPVVRWPCKYSITYKVNLRYAAGNRAGRSAALRDVKQAFRRVGKVSGLKFVYRGQTKEVPTSRSGKSWFDRQRAAEMVVAWVKEGQSSLMMAGRVSGVGGWAYKAFKPSGSTKYQAPIGRGFVVLRQSHNKYYRQGFGSGATRGALLLHEIMHAVGLGHVNSKSELMYPQMLRRSRTRFGRGDANGLRKVGKRAGCYMMPSTIWKQI